MADKDRRPPPPTHVGRSNIPPVSSNVEEDTLPEFEPFGIPRGPPNLRDFLDIWDVNMLKNQDEINKKEHHTDLYDNVRLIVRRGQPFQIQLTFNRPYNPDKDQFCVEFLIGGSPQVSKGTYIPIFPNQEQVKGEWGCRILQSEDNVVTLSITPAADSIVGKFRMYVAIMTPYGIRRTARNPERDIYILFNPWCEDDSVYLDNEAERNEYVLNDAGTIYYGEASNVETRPWIFGQFEYGVLDACLYVMDNAQMPLTGRKDPVKVSRVASAMVNSKDDDGIVVGSWSGDYLYGVAPTAWTGSVEILLNYASSGVPVCYGQCWVFAAVFNTFLRCLGMPGRVVTNFFSAHDNDGNLKMDVILDENGQFMPSLTKDSIWNYHCWNECYMSRPDIPAGFGGWQAVDATPQETSDGMYRCGPASVKAIKHGQICYKYDAPFIFAEVNSDVVYWKRMRDGTQEPIKVNKHHVGEMVLTKEVGRDEIKNITDQYKFPEGTEEERLAVDAAVMYNLKRTQITEQPTVVNMNVRVQDRVFIGNDFNLTLEFKNSTGQHQTLVIYINGNIVFYTGVTKMEFMSKSLEFTLGPWQTKTEKVFVEGTKYINKLVDQATLHFIITGRVNDNKQILTAQHVLPLQIPRLTVKVEGVPKLNEEISVTVEFTNPLKKNLDNVSIRLEGPGLMKSKVKMYSFIPPNSSLRWTEYFRPSKTGVRKLVACLDCAALHQVHGVTEIYVNP
ncbi:coagulation factor XIII A chain-like [Polyodon spathula]|uniref:coagulation factor XIII A chain-like n=1 Tax=Polyodon spathula TaxID=7913 RepID=UPI001B7DF7C9|nr:coagulation factor XIII A chain-like [Polyodon spathula]